MESMPAISARGIVKSFPRFELRVSNLSVQRGDFVTVIGPSGSGKSTLLKIIGGFVKPEEGTVMVSGEDVSSQRGPDRKIRTVFQDLALFPHLVVSRQLHLAARSARSKDLAATVNQWIELLELGQQASSLPRELSGGQRQRLALGRALISQPDIVLLDEPTTALDLARRAQLWEYVDKARTEALANATTFVVVTHDPDLALSRSTMILALDEGRQVQLDTPRNLYAAPVTESVARLLGPANTLKIGGRRILIRPEKIVFVSETSSGALPAKVLDATYHGSMYQLYLHCTDQIIRMRLSTSNRPPETGSGVWISWDPADATLLSTN